MKIEIIQKSQTALLGGIPIYYKSFDIIINKDGTWGIIFYTNIADNDALIKIKRFKPSSKEVEIKNSQGEFLLIGEALPVKNNKEIFEVIIKE